jgi:hypothetical protein
MRRAGLALAVFLPLITAACDWRIGTGYGVGRIVGHENATVEGLDKSSVEQAKRVLDIAYWHTSHGSQLTSGMAGMDAFFGGTGLYSVGGPDGLRLTEPAGTDLGVSNGDTWEPITRAYLQANPSTNVVIWSWCGQVSSSSEADIELYLQRMTQLEEDYPNVRFVYMTGHSDGSGTDGNLHQRNMQIREYCELGGKFLYDFYDIECYDPDGVYYGDRNVADSCAYDGGNWAVEWQNENPGEWWNCGSAHSEPLNANLKAMAAWQLWVRLADSL